MKSKYTIPKLNKASKYWYVHYRYEGKQFRETRDLNKIADLKIREAEYVKLCNDILLELKNGYNPNIPDSIQPQNDMFIIKALKEFIEEKNKIVEMLRSENTLLRERLAVYSDKDTLK
jgi:hypothetical protein